jgi:hypothetical protein
MSERDPTKGRELVPDAWRELDDTLADGGTTRDVPPEAKAWLADQRLLHGLLRALHTQDAASREARVEAILARIDAEGDGAGLPRRHWWAVLAAAVLLAVFGVWASLPAALPTAEAAVRRAVAELGRDVARRFRVVVHRTDARGKPLADHEFALVTRPGGRFRLAGRFEFGGVPLGEIQVGCDGQELWLTSANGAWQRAVPFAERERLQAAFGDVLDLGYLDLHDLVRKLPDDFTLEVVGREQDDDGRRVLRIEARRKGQGAARQLRSAFLRCDEQTGMVVQLDGEVELPRGGTWRLETRYLGEEPPGLVEFARPWR